MDYKELMCGDWVKVEQVTEVVNAKVLGVYKDGINYEVDYSGVRATNQIHIDYVSPVKLTGEILVNNGFVGVPLTDSYELNTDYYEIEVWNYSDGLWVVNVHWIEFSSTPESKATVSYVHELQHLFRLCGVEKELVID